MSTAPKRFITPEQYLASERKVDYKSEYFAGDTFAMGGASRNHVRIVSNLVQALGQLLRSKHCEVASTALHVWIPSSGLYTYPDVVVTCGEEDFQDDHFDVLLNPILIVEVLSPSTEDYDRGHKFAAYRTIPSMREYLTVAQDRCFIEQWTKRESTEWMPVSFTDSNATVRLESIGAVLALADVYRNIV